MILVLSLDGGSGWRAVCGAGLGVGRPGFVVTPVAGSEEACLQRQKIQELEESKNDDKRLKSSNSFLAVATAGVNLLASDAHGKKSEQPGNEGGGCS